MTAIIREFRPENIPDDGACCACGQAGDDVEILFRLPDGDAYLCDQCVEMMAEQIKTARLGPFGEA